jgi:hypothetical protein
VGRSDFFIVRTLLKYAGNAELLEQTTAPALRLGRAALGFRSRAAVCAGDRSGGAYGHPAPARRDLYFAVRRRETVEFTPALRDEAERLAAEALHLAESHILPAPNRQPRKMPRLFASAAVPAG